MSTEQTPTNNESLSVERIPFDLEWAKRGGVISTAVNEDPALAKLLTTKSDGRVLFMFFVKHEENEKWHYGFLQKDELHFLQMATHEECEVAGVAYIEKPVSAEELAELRRDSERLDFICDNHAESRPTMGGSYYAFFQKFMRPAKGDTPREAIDSAMKGK